MVYSADYSSILTPGMFDDRVRIRYDTNWFSNAFYYEGGVKKGEILTYRPEQGSNILNLDATNIKLGTIENTRLPTNYGTQLGIGISPVVNTKLHIYDATNSIIRLETDAGGQAGIEFQRGTRNDVNVDFKIVNDAGRLRFQSQDEVNLYTSATSEVMRMTRGQITIFKNAQIDGNMSIGVLPHATYKLDILGDTQTIGKVGINTAPHSTYNLDILGDTRTTGKVGINTTPHATYNLDILGDTRTTGKVGINTTPHATYNLDILGDSRTIGNVGIGTTPNTTYKLDVSGNTRIQGGIVLTGVIQAGGGITVSSGQALTAGGLITANAGITIPSGQTLTANGGISSTTISASTITASGLITANAGLTIASGQTLTTNTMTASGLITANAGLTIPSGQTLTSGGTLTANIINTSGLITTNGGLNMNNTTTSETKLVIQNQFITTGLPTTISVAGTTGGVIGTTDRILLFTYTTDTVGFTGITQYSFTTSEILNIDILIIGGGGGGGNGDGSSNEPGGGGAGGIVYMVNKTLQVGTYKVNVGKGGASNQNGFNSSIIDNLNNNILFDNIMLIGYGGGKGATTSSQTGSNGGSGGGGGNNQTNGGLATQGNTFWSGTSYVAGGFNGARASASSRAGGGGGAGEVGSTDGTGFGGDGRQVSITGTATFYGGGGNGYDNFSTTRSDGGGGTLNGVAGVQNGGAGLANTGSGGAGAYGGSGYVGGAGGSGYVAIRYRKINQSATSIDFVRGTSIDSNPDFTIRNDGDLEFISSSANNPQTRMTITNDGKVGIATITPSSIFQIGNGGRLRIATQADDYTMIGTADIDGVDNTRIVLATKAGVVNNNAILYIASGVGTHIWETTDARVERMRIANNGRVGIGTNNPTTARLVIARDAGYVDGLDLASTDAYAQMRVIRNQYTDRNMFLGYQSGGGSIIYMYSNDQDTMRLQSGNVTVNNTLTVGNELYVGGNTNLRNTVLYSGNESSGIALYFSTPFTGSPFSAAKSAIIAEPITNHSRHHLAICLNRVNSNSVNVGTGDVYMRFHQDDYITVYKRFIVYNEMYGGFYSVSMTNTDYLCVQGDYGGNGAYGERWIKVAFGSFTAFHRCYTDDELYNNDTQENIDLFKNNYMGRVVIATGKIKTDFSKTTQAPKDPDATDDEPPNENNEWYSEINKDGINIEDAVPIIQLSRKKKDKRVFGVLGAPKRSTNNKDRLIVNSIGEGAICVANTNGNIENGDYIQSSDLLGYGEKQDDDLTHNYTIGKATIDCNFELNSPYYQSHEIENGVIVAFIACSYCCG
jgi:hypothetical protein